MQKISIVIPIYNVEPYLHQCLDSVINQTYRNLEIILIDDGSPDNCGAICDEYAATDNRIVVIHKSNAGLCAARNDGLRRATGDWVAFIDSDDWCDLNYYEMFMNMSDIKTADVLYAGGGIWEQEGNSEIKRSVIKVFSNTFADTPRSDRKAQLQARVLAKIQVEDFARSCAGGYCWDKLYRTDFLRINGLRFDTDQRAQEDELFNFKAVGKAEKIIAGTFVGYHYRWNPLSITKTLSPRVVDNALIFANKLYESYKYGDSKIIDRSISINIIRKFSKCLKYYFGPAAASTSNAEVRNAVAKLKSDPCVRDAIHFHGTLGIPPKILLLKWTLCLPWVWPLRLLFTVRQTVMSIIQAIKPRIETVKGQV